MHPSAACVVLSRPLAFFSWSVLLLLSGEGNVGAVVRMLCLIKECSTTSDGGAAATGATEQNNWATIGPEFVSGCMRPCNQVPGMLCGTFAPDGSTTFKLSLALRLHLMF